MTVIYYDGECPFCARYTELVRLRESVGPVELVNVREATERRAELEREGFELDQGMVFEHEGRRYGGAEALHQISLLSHNWRLFRSSLLARITYPFLRAGRALTLFAMQRERIKPDDLQTLSLFALFSHTWGVFSVLHLLYYIYYPGVTHTYLTTWAIGVMGAWLAIRPRSPRLFAALAAVTIVDAWAQMPVYSNHTVLRNFVLLAMMAAAALTWLRGKSWADFLRTFAPAGRAMLCVMYVFGVFHKINSDFLDPSVSCAVALWETMPEPLNWLNADWFKYCAIYGTLVGETLILAGLLTKRFRHLSIMAGIAFHSILALSGYGFYPSFSTLTIALHLLYLSPQAADRITTSIQWRNMQRQVHSRVGILLAVAWFCFMWMLTKMGNTSSLGLAWLPWAAWMMGMVWREGRERVEESTLGAVIRSRNWAVNLVSAAFFLNCFAPYLGLKNAQSINMFANLVYEGGRSNHLLFSGPPGPFGYLNDVVKPTHAAGNQYLLYAQQNGLYITYYDLLNQLERTRDAVVTYERSGQVYDRKTYNSLRPEIERELHPRWFRNWFLFRPIDLSERKACSISQ